MEENMRFNVTLPNNLGEFLNDLSLVEGVLETELIRRSVQAIYNPNLRMEIDMDKFKTVEPKMLKGFSFKDKDEIILFLTEEENQLTINKLKQQKCSKQAALFMFNFDDEHDGPFVRFGSKSLMRTFTAIRTAEDEFLVCTDENICRNTPTTDTLRRSSKNSEVCKMTSNEMAIFFQEAF